MNKDAPHMPDVNGFDHITRWLAELDFIALGHGGAMALPHTEIRAWALSTDARPTPTEVRWLRKMSQEYAAELRRSDGKDTEEPMG